VEIPAPLPGSQEFRPDLRFDASSSVHYRVNMFCLHCCSLSISICQVVTSEAYVAANPHDVNKMVFIEDLCVEISGVSLEICMDVTGHSRSDDVNSTSAVTEYVDVLRA